MRRPFGKLVEDNDPPLDLTPMLDVVFILLIFFVVTSSFVRESGIDVNKPDAKTATPKEKADIFVAINHHNEIWIDKRNVDARALTSVLERMRADNPGSGMVIQADKNSTNAKLVKVMDAARAVGIFDIAIATDPK